MESLKGWRWESSPLAFSWAGQERGAAGGRLRSALAVLGGQDEPPGPGVGAGEPLWLQAGLCRHAGEQPWARRAIRTASAELVTDLFSKWDPSAASVAFLPGPPLPPRASVSLAVPRGAADLGVFAGAAPPRPRSLALRLSVRPSVHTPTAPLLYAPSPWMPMENRGGSRGRDLSRRSEEQRQGPTPAWTHPRLNQPRGVPAELPPRFLHRSRVMPAGKVSRSNIVPTPGLLTPPPVSLNCPRVPSPA